MALLIAPASIAGAQSPNTPAVNKANLVPIVVDDGKLEGEVTLSVDLDDSGKVKQTMLVSGPNELYAAADKVTRMFNHKQFPAASGVLQQVSFWKKKNGMKKAAPIYPPIARAAHVSGTVQLIAVVDADGHVTQVVPVSGPDMLKGSAIDAVKQWIYPQFLLNGIAEQFHAVIEVNYKL